MLVPTLHMILHTRQNHVSANKIYVIAFNFQGCKQNEMITEWCNENEVTKYKEVKECVAVFNKFEGRAFAEIRDGRCA